MTGFVVVCDDDGIIFGVGDTKRSAWNDAEEWIMDAMCDHLRDEISEAAERGVSVGMDLTWRAWPATAALMQSVSERGGYDDWHKCDDGTLDLGRKGGAP